MADIQNLQQLLAMRAELKRVVTQLLTADAAKRLAAVRATRPQLALQLELYLAELAKAGQLKAPVDEPQLKQLISSLSEKKAMRIIRK